MSKTHITVGIAASLAICVPMTADTVLTALAGGAVGGIICDIECRSTPKMRDALQGRIIAAGIVVLALIADWMLNAGVLSSIMAQNKISLIVGTIILLAVCILGRASDHRTFTHSFLFVLLIFVGVLCISPKLSMPVLAGSLSHLIIDTLNKKPVPWLYPIRKKGFCLKLCYASGVGNSILMWVGLAASISLLVWRITSLNV